MLKRTLSIVFALALPVIWVPTLVEADPVISAPSVTVDVNDVFTIPISIAGATDLQAFQFDLTYNPAILSLLSFTDVGTDFDTAATAGGGFLTGITGFSFLGLLSGVADSMSGAVTGLSGSGVLVDIEFLAIAPGVSPLILINASLTDNGQFLSSENGDFTLQNSQVPVTAVPEPATLMLLTSGLALLGMRRLARRGRRDEV